MAMTMVTFIYVEIYETDKNICFQFYVEQLSFSEDAQAGGDQCAINNPYVSI